MSGKDGDEELRTMAANAFATPFAAVLQLAPDSGDAIWIDGHATPPAILMKAPKKKPADCTWRGVRESLMRALESERAATSAFVSGRITISGDMSVMARIQMEGTR